MATVEILANIYLFAALHRPGTVLSTNTMLFVNLYDSLGKEYSYFHFTDEEILVRGRIPCSRTANVRTLQCEPWDSPKAESERLPGILRPPDASGQARHSPALQFRVPNSAVVSY